MDNVNKIALAIMTNCSIGDLITPKKLTQQSGVPARSFSQSLRSLEYDGYLIYHGKDGSVNQYKYIKELTPDSPVRLVYKDELNSRKQSLSSKQSTHNVRIYNISTKDLMELTIMYGDKVVLDGEA